MLVHRLLAARLGFEAFLANGRAPFDEMSHGAGNPWDFVFNDRTNIIVLQTNRAN